MQNSEIRMQTRPGELRARPIAIGCMRLSTERDRDEARAIQVLHAAFDGGVTLLDTADAYCLDDTDAGHNERLIAQALASWSGDRSRIVVATKGGLTRPNGEWVANGKARHLRAACEASLRALGVQCIHLYQLHTPDPRTPLATSVRALDALRREGLIERIGLCNVNVGQIEEARRITEISAVQVELNLWHDTNLLNGVVQHCIEHAIQLIAYRPLGGARQSRRLLSDPVLVEIAARHDATPAEIALAWLDDLSEAIVSIPGPTKVETVRSVIRARRLRNRYFQDDLFADPAWDMLLDLLQAEIAQLRVPVSSLCIAAAVPATTALRWLKTMTDQGIFRRRADPHDGRRVFVELSPEASVAMRRYFADVGTVAVV